MNMQKKPTVSCSRDLVEPDWREREVERYKALAAAMPAHKPLVQIGRRTEPCGECHLQPGERCDICGAVAL